MVTSLIVVSIYMMTLYQSNPNVILTPVNETTPVFRPLQNVPIYAFYSANLTLRGHFSNQVTRVAGLEPPFHSYPLPLFYFPSLPPSSILRLVLRAISSRNRKEMMILYSPLVYVLDTCIPLSFLPDKH